jgi:hypothetical protein
VLLEEELRVEPLPHQPALHVGKRDDDGVDLAAGGEVGQLLDRHGRDPMPNRGRLEITDRGRG